MLKFSPSRRGPGLRPYRLLAPEDGGQGLARYLHLLLRAAAHSASAQANEAMVAAHRQADAEATPLLHRRKGARGLHALSLRRGRGPPSAQQI